MKKAVLLAALLLILLLLLARPVRINDLSMISDDEVEAARSTLVIGGAT